MFKLHLTDNGKRDILEIGWYIYEQLDSPVAAINTVEKIEVAIRKIPDNPYIYPKVRDDRLAAMGYRSVVINNYVAFFVIDEAAKIVSIDRVIYGRRDWAHIL
ncbi:MAG: type II toxin-antitoxin system RelE/ParE family toxin [Oscillospiraceae bacterium]|jgi:plasmid stabilization system protein ParE|nr:type II toxin-antitoxin system RelE/ParE family toxin [Oscillospiraceae bacterium]